MKKQPFWKSQNRPRMAFTPPPQMQMKPLKILVAVFTGPERAGWVNPGLTTALMRLAYDPRLQTSYVPVHAIYPVSAARNTAVNEFFLKSDCDVMVIFDNDVAPPINIADVICSMPPEAKIGVLPYWVWLPNEKHTMPCFGAWSDGVMIIPDPATLKPGWQEMGAGGTGCMSIRREVFTSGKLERPFFKIISTADKGQVVSEDIYFTGRAAEVGYPTWVNVDHVCSHFHTIDLADINYGIVKVLQKFTETIRGRYGDVGIKLNTLIQELHPELMDAAKKLQGDIGAAYDQHRKESEEVTKTGQAAMREAVKK